MTAFKRYTLFLLALLGACTAQISQAAVSLDRTRVIFIGGEKSVSLSISNQNTQLPYLAQGWIENEQGEKITSPMVVLPPVQRLEPGSSSQIKIQGLSELNLLAQDRESIFYFNLREIPPRSDKANTLQIALQTRVKLFYRPAQIAAKKGLSEAPWQEKLTLLRQGDHYQIINPTPFFITVIEAAPDRKASSPAEFKPLMIPPKSRQDLGLSTKVLGEKPVLTYVNDYGGRPQLQFSCVAGNCTASPVTDKK